MIKNIPKKILRVFSEIEWLTLAPIFAVNMLASEIETTAGQKTYPKAPDGRSKSEISP
jgi:hypothetical protein